MTPSTSAVLYTPARTGRVPTASTPRRSRQTPVPRMALSSGPVQLPTLGGGPPGFRGRRPLPVRYSPGGARPRARLGRSTDFSQSLVLGDVPKGSCYFEQSECPSSRTESPGAILARQFQDGRRCPHGALRGWRIPAREPWPGICTRGESLFSCLIVARITQKACNDAQRLGKGGRSQGKKRGIWMVLDFFQLRRELEI